MMKKLFLTILAISTTCLFGCGSNTGITAKSVDDVTINPRIYEGKEISVMGTLKPSEDAQKLVSIGAILEGADDSKRIYLINFAAQADFGSKYVITGEFQTLTIPILGSFLVLDAKSVEPCSKISAC